MTSQNFSNRSKEVLELTIIFGVAATRVYHDGVEDADTLNRLGCVKTVRFDSLAEMKAFILGIEEATGYLDTHFVDD